MFAKMFFSEHLIWNTGKQVNLNHISFFYKKNVNSGTFVYAELLADTNITAELYRTVKSKDINVIYDSLSKEK